jgi:hypothetical protein
MHSYFRCMGSCLGANLSLHSWLCVITRAQNESFKTNWHFTCKSISKSTFRHAGYHVIVVYIRSMFCNNHFMSTYLQSNCIYLVTLGRAGLLRPRTYTLVKWAVPQDLPQYMSQIPLMRAFRAHAGMDEWRMHLAIALLYNTECN